jgi:hypothetical protein
MLDCFYSDQKNLRFKKSKEKFSLLLYNKNNVYFVNKTKKIAVVLISINNFSKL